MYSDGARRVDIPVNEAPLSWLGAWSRTHHVPEIHKLCYEDKDGDRIVLASNNDVRAAMSASITQFIAMPDTAVTYAIKQPWFPTNTRVWYLGHPSIVLHRRTEDHKPTVLTVIRPNGSYVEAVMEELRSYPYVVGDAVWATLIDRKAPVLATVKSVTASAIEKGGWTYVVTETTDVKTDKQAEYTVAQWQVLPVQPIPGQRGLMHDHRVEYRSDELLCEVRRPQCKEWTHPIPADFPATWQPRWFPSIIR
jgi:hypothetical protein